MRRHSSFSLVWLLGTLAAITVAAWFLPIPAMKGSAALSGDKLVIITPHWDGIRNEFRRSFPDWYQQRTGKSIHVEYLDVGGTSDCVKYIKSEFKRNPQGIGIDLFFGGGTDPYLDLKREGLLSPVRLDSAIISPIPADFSGMAIYDPEGYWYGAALSGFGIIHNKWVTKSLGFSPPREWKDLADPRYATWIGIADPRSSGTMHLMFEIVLQAYGWERGWAILTGMAANARTYAKAAGDVPRMVSRGDMAFGLAVDFYAWAEVSEAGEDKVGFLLPENLTVVTADAVGVLKGAPQHEAARLFIEFLLSEPGQKIWFLRRGMQGGPEEQELNRMSVRPDFYSRFQGQTNVRENPFAASGTFHFDNELASRRWGILNDLIGASLIDRNELLRKAWRLRSAADDRVWLGVAVAESTLLRLSESEWKDPVAKNAHLVTWHEFYESKYRRILGGAR